MKKKYFLGLLALAGLVACQNDVAEIDDVADVNEVRLNTNSILGEKLNNPYSLENMQNAYDELHSGAISKSGTILEPTHLYLRFNPQSQEELDKLEADTNLLVFGFPIDRDIVAEGDIYNDPLVEGNNYQYATVEVGYPIPDVEYTVEQELYNLDEVSNKSLSKSANADWELLKQKSFELTGNEIEVQEFSKSWRPEGKITMNGKGLEGFWVRMHRFCFGHQGITDADGYFKSDSKANNKWNYSLKLRRSDKFKVCTETDETFALTSAYEKILLSHTKSSCVYDLNFGNTSSKEFDMVRIFQSAHSYYYKDIAGLPRPAEKVYLMTIEYQNPRNIAHRALFINNQIGQNIYANTIKELAYYTTINKGYEKKFSNLFSDGISWYICKTHLNQDTSNNAIKELVEKGIKFEDIVSAFKKEKTLAGFSNELTLRYPNKSSVIKSILAKY